MANTKTTTSYAELNGWWPWALLAGAVALFVGGMLHPHQDPALSGAAALGAWIGDPLWVPAHSLILLSSILFLSGLFGLLRARLGLSAAARRAGWVAVIATALWMVESMPHLAATTDSAAALAAQSTPFLSAHMVLSLAVYPLFGFSVAALALLSARNLVHPVVGTFGAVGGIAVGIAPWAVGPLGIDALGVLFVVAPLLISVWFAAVGTLALLRHRSGTAPSARTPAGA